MGLAGVAVFRRLRPALKIRRTGWIDSLILLSTAGILAIVFVTAVVSPPNSADAMAYHLPRVVYWIEQRSVSFFATPYLNQIMLQPFAEYLMLHSMLLTGGDHFVNLVQLFGCVTSLVAIAGIAQRFGAGLRGQLLAALVCVTIPNGILQASGAKNDYVLAGWLASTIYFLLRPDETRFTPLLAGLSLGLALGTKATAYLFVPPLILWVAIRQWRWWREQLRAAVLVALAALTLNLPQFARNVDLSGSPLGFDSAQADEKFRWRNEAINPQVIASNFLRHSTEQLGMRSERWNESVYRLSVNLQRRIGIGENDPRNTWLWTSYGPPRNSNQEADAPNTWHLAIFAACFLACAWLRRDLFLYLCALVAGFLLFCAYLKWQPYMARLFLSLFVLASPVAGILIARLPSWTQVIFALFLLNNSRHPLFENWTRPLAGAHSLFHTSREDAYFNDMVQWNARDGDRKAAEEVIRSGCGVVGIDANTFQLEYPVQELIFLDRKFRFVHVGVTNPSRKYQKPDDPAPCITLRLRADGVDILR